MTMQPRSPSNPPRRNPSKVHEITWQAPEFMAEINTTPFIDILLVLLIMLMISIPLQFHAFQIRLPAATAAKANPSDSAPIWVVQMTAEQAYVVAGEVLDLEALSSRLSLALKQTPGLAVELVPAPDLAYDHVIQTLARMRQLGATRATLSVPAAPGRGG